ncbi:MAG: Holliday junction branch migration protein RuvA [Oscillospiraceae bacterium]|nr:Holliday junction branch migration protein RuvA [Oscillospiraceae bacterium]
MFYYLSGTVTHTEPNLAVIDVGGAGYGCAVSGTTLAQLETGKKVKLYTYCNIREDAFDIYGFYTLAEKRSFELLLGVTGVGPRVALAILTANRPEALSTAVITGNEKALTAAAGVGKKLAQRIILELRDKLSAESTELAGSSGAVVSAVGKDKLSDAMAALAVLGYGPGEINAALKGVDVENLTLEDIIRQSLKKMMK